MKMLAWTPAPLHSGKLGALLTCDRLEDYVRKHRPLFITIDSLTACLAGMDVDLIKSNAGDVIYGLRDIANTYKCSILILHHLNKSGGTSRLNKLC